MTVNRLVDLRREVGMTQAELSIEVGVSQSYIARLEKKTLDPKLSIVNKIFEVLTSRQGKNCYDIMTIDPLTIDDRDPAAQAVRLMQKHNYSQIPVLRGTKMVGIITERDIIRNLRHDMREL